MVAQSSSDSASHHSLPASRHLASEKVSRMRLMRSATGDARLTARPGGRRDTYRGNLASPGKGDAPAEVTLDEPPVVSVWRVPLPPVPSAVAVAGLAPRSRDRDEPLPSDTRSRRAPGGARAWRRRRHLRDHRRLAPGRSDRHRTRRGEPARSRPETPVAAAASHRGNRHRQLGVRWRADVKPVVRTAGIRRARALAKPAC